MSETEPVRTKVAGAARARDRRTVDDRLILLLRRSSLGLPVIAALFRLSPRSRLRQALFRRQFVRALAALNRRDYEFYTCHMRPDVEYIPPRRGDASAWAGMDEVFRGRDDVRRFHEEWNADWGDVTFAPAEIFDMGDRGLFLFRGAVRGRGSGVEMEQNIAVLITIESGWLVRWEFFMSWEEGLAAAGLAPEPATAPP